MKYYEETLEMIKERKQEIADRFEQECIRLLNSGAIDKEDHSRGTLFGVAIENISEDYLRGYNRKTADYKNLKRF